MSEAVENLREVRRRIREACKKSGRGEEEVTLIAVSKTWPATALEPYIEAGHFEFGENKLQELQVKAPAFSEDLQWHFIGGLQRNKVRKVLAHSHCVHSVDSLKLAQALSRIAGEEDKVVELFLQVNIGEEESKGGFTPQELMDSVCEIVALPHLKVRGLMCIPPAVDNPEEARPFFKQLFELRERCEAQFDLQLPFLSMGMSSDYWVAVEEGATHVRVGSALFGQRA